MKTSTILTAALTALLTTATAQILNIPSRSGNIISLPSASVIKSSFDGGNKEYDRGRACNTDDDTGSVNAVFIIENGAALSSVIIGANQLEGVHCKGACTITNVWFRDVCEGSYSFRAKHYSFPSTPLARQFLRHYDALTSFQPILTNSFQSDAISLLGQGNVLISGGGAQNAVDKVVQHNGRGTVTIRDYTVVNAGKLYRSCGDCSNNGGPRNVVVSVSCTFAGLCLSFCGSPFLPSSYPRQISHGCFRTCICPRAFHLQNSNLYSTQLPTASPLQWS